MYNILKQHLPTTRLFANEPMMTHTAFRVGGPAEVYALPASAEELCTVIRLCKQHGSPYTLLGRASNVLILDEGIRGVVIQVHPHMNHFRLMEANRLWAEAGVSLSVLAQTACQSGLSGLAFAAGIPGTVGGALYMNAGAYNHDMHTVCASVEVLYESGEITVIPAADMEFAYRHSRLQNEGIALSAIFALTPGDPAHIRAEMTDLNERRRKTQPLEYPSAGSTFKRPTGHFAGKLIMDSGLKGFAIGGACVSEKHAGFIINTGGATASDILRLIAHVQETVYQQFGVMLEPEIKIIGR